jgi:sorting nexin-1/2
LTLRRDFEDVSRLIKSEMVRFDKEKTADFKDAIEKYSERLAIRQREIVDAWRRFVETLESGIKGNKNEQQQQQQHVNHAVHQNEGNAQAA